MADCADHPPPTVLRAESQSLRFLWWRPSADRKSAARLGGRVMNRTRPKSRSAAHQSCAAQRASRRLLTEMPCQGPGEEACSTRRQPSSTTRVWLQREAAESSSMEEGILRTANPIAEPTSGPTVWRRGQRLEKVASGLTHRSAQHLTPLRGRPLRTEEAMERAGAEVSALRPKLEDQGSIFGPMTRPSSSHLMAT